MYLVVALLTDLSDCYLTSTKLEISEVQNQLILLLESTNNTICEQFPPGVNIQLIYSNKTLDVQKVVTNFNYSTTTKIQIDVTSIDAYFNILLAQFRIKSYDLRYEHQLQEVLITRNDQNQVFKNFVIDYDQTVFNANVTYPKTFTTMNVIDAYINITTYQQIYQVIFDGKPLITAATNQLSLNFPNSDLSTILYESGISNIVISVTYGKEAQATGVEKTFDLLYKNQPSAGEFLTFKIFEKSIFTAIEPSAYFIENVEKYAVIGVLYSVNEGFCGFKANFESKIVLENMKINKNFMSFMDVRNFPNNTGTGIFAQEYSECIEYARNEHDLDISFIFENEQGEAKNRFSLFTNIESSLYKNGRIDINDDHVIIKCQRVNESDSQQLGFLRVKIFLTNESLFLNQYEEVINKQTQIGGDIEMEVWNLNKSVIRKMRSAYFMRVAVYNHQKQRLDEFDLTEFNDDLKEQIMYNLIVFVIILCVDVLIVSIVIFKKKKPANNKKKRVKIQCDDIE